MLGNNSIGSAPSLLDSGEVASKVSTAGLDRRINSQSLVDIMYDGFYLVFLLRNHYFSNEPRHFRQKIYDFLDKFEIVYQNIILLYLIITARRGRIKRKGLKRRKCCDQTRAGCDLYCAPEGRISRFRLHAGL